VRLKAAGAINYVAEKCGDALIIGGQVDELCSSAAGLPLTHATCLPLSDFVRGRAAYKRDVNYKPTLQLDGYAADTLCESRFKVYVFLCINSTTI